MQRQEEVETACCRAEQALTACSNLRFKAAPAPALDRIISTCGKVCKQLHRETSRENALDAAAERRGNSSACAQEGEAVMPDGVKN